MPSLWRKGSSSRPSSGTSVHRAVPRQPGISSRLAFRELCSLVGLLQLSPAVLSLGRSASDFYSILSFLNKSAFLHSWRNNQSPMISPSGKFTKLLSIFCFLGRVCQNFWVPSMRPECKISLRTPSQTCLSRPFCLLIATLMGTILPLRHVLFRQNTQADSFQGPKIGVT